jgi:hypothetical protein
MRKDRLLFAVFAAAIAISTAACGASVDPATARISARLKDAAVIPGSELGPVFEQIERLTASRTVRFEQGTRTGELERAQRTVVLGMLIDRAGVYDEGLQEHDGKPARVFNAPGTSSNAEHTATRRLWIDVDTLLPVHFEFTDTASYEENYAYNLSVS